jgi:hypothetical protein
MQAVLLMQGVVINDLLTQITAVFVTIRGASNGSGAKTTGNCRILADPRHGPGDAGGHDRLTQLGWVYDGFGGYRKKTASSHPGPKIAASNVQVYGRFRPSNG